MSAIKDLANTTGYAAAMLWHRCAVEMIGVFSIVKHVCEMFDSRMLAT